VTFYSHPSTDNKGGRATKNTMGRWSHIYLKYLLIKNAFITYYINSKKKTPIISNSRLKVTSILLFI
jgi:hypothetical protein